MSIDMQIMLIVEKLNKITTNITKNSKRINTKF